MLYLYMRCRIDISFFICKLKSETLENEISIEILADYKIICIFAIEYDGLTGMH